MFSPDDLLILKADRHEIYSRKTSRLNLKSASLSPLIRRFIFHNKRCLQKSRSTAVNEAKTTPRPVRSPTTIAVISDTKIMPLFRFNIGAQRLFNDHWSKKLKNNYESKIANYAVFGR